MSSMTHPFPPFPIGQTFDKAPLSLDLCRAQNFHILALGMSGSGKTYLLRRLVSYLLSQGVSVHILDAQGDFSPHSFQAAGIINDRLDTHYTDFEFSYDNESCGLNPLLLSDHPQSGGVYMACLEFIQIARIFNSALSKIQESMLQQMLEETYRRKGITHDNPESWRLPAPTLADLDELMGESLDLLSDGFNKSDASMKSLIRVYNRIRNAREKMARHQERLKGPDLDDGDVEMLNKEINTLFESISDGEKKGDVIWGRLKRGHLLEAADLQKDSTFEEHLSNWRASSVSSLRATTHGMLSSRLFSGTDVRPLRGRLNRYDLKALGQRDQLAMIRVLLSKIFSRAMRSCPPDRLNSSIPSEFIVLDEGKIAAASSTQQMSALNRIATEGRKFGLGMIVGVQSPDHVTEELKVNFASKFVLSVDPGALPILKRSLGVPPERMHGIQPRRDALVSLNGGRFVQTHLFS